MIKYVLPVAILIGATAPAFAAEYYVVRGPDKKCSWLVAFTRAGDAERSGQPFAKGGFGNRWTAEPKGAVFNQREISRCRFAADG